MIKKIPIITPLSICFVLILFLSVSIGYSRLNKNETRLNILLITIDTLRADRVGCYSKENLQTPNMDAIAEQGVVFKRAFTHNPTTLPAHANMLLGLTPLYHGVRENTNFVVRQEFLTLAEYLKSAGYATGAFIGGFPLHSRFGLAQGFGVYDENYEAVEFIKFSAGERKAEAVINPALGWLDKQDTPWFLWIHCYDPHDPYDPPEPFMARYRESLYDGEVAYVDFELGKVLAYLAKNNLFDQTLIVFTGDHGESLGQHGEVTHGYLAYNTTMWIPLIIAAPDFNPRQVDQLVCHVDIFPTICDICGLKKPSFLQGISLLPGMKGKRLPKRTIYFESLYPYYSRGWAPINGFINGKEKYIQSPIPELFDLEEDFVELNNLAKNQNLEKQRKKLEQIMKDRSHPTSEKARQRIDRESLERLRSLGYISNPQSVNKKNFGPGDDVKSLLPFHNKATQAWEFFLDGKVRDGMDLVKEVITEREDIDIAYTNLARMYKEQGKLKDALSVLKTGMEKLPSNYGVIVTYVNFLNIAGQYEDIIEVLSDRWLPQMEHDPEIWNYLGLAYSNTGDFENALHALEQALSIDDKFALAFKNIGNIHLSQFQKSKSKDSLQKAIQNYERAVELEPDYGAAFNSLGVSYKESGRTDAAIRCWEKAFELRPDVGYPLLNLGLAYMEKGNNAKALEYFEEYKKRFYHSLPSRDKEKVDSFIQRCKKGS
ncbi:MAG: sulfatase-like hydrolase/transferase [Candidatus Aminicenantes bacterium]|nr:MAG: sulfatase-like hydrolase/transferase [Candidatus Aminicenantes bacterium]